MQKSSGRRGQVTIFIIIAIVIIAVVATVFYLIPKTKTATGFDSQNPIGFIQNCLEDRLTDMVSSISSQGGSFDPEFYFTYQGDNIEYLCYTGEYYRNCVVQQPLLKQHIETEIKDSIAPNVETCFANLQESYRTDGFTVSLQTGRTEVDLLPKRVAVSFPDYILTATRGDTARHENFNIVLNNNLYELVGIASSIIEWESNYGDAETTLYMGYYRDLKVEKHTQNDGTKVYIITDRNTENKFQFASRSGALPPGYGVAGVST